MDDKEVYIVGKVNLNPVDNDIIPCVEIVLDTASGRTNGEIVLLKEIHKTDNEYYYDKIKGVKE